MGIDLGSCNTRDVRHLTAEDLVLQIERCFDIESLDILELRVSRIDFTADVKDLPVEWFRRHCRVRQKRLSTQWREVTKSGVTSLEIGKRPDLYRIYNKVQERKDKGKKVLYQGKWNGLPEPCITRIERQCCAQAIPHNMASLQGLFDNAESADPYAALLLDDAPAIPNSDTWTAQRLLMNLGLDAAVKAYGEQEVRGLLNRKGRNAERYFSRYSDLLRAEGRGINNDRLREIYQKSTIWQLNQLRDGHYPSGGRLVFL